MVRWILPLFALLVPLTAAAEPERALHRPMVAEPESLDPEKFSGQPEAIVAEDLFEGLLTRSPTGDPIPGVALSWETSSDGRAWTFHLRPDEAWSNGDRLTAEDFVYSFRRQVDPKTASPYAAALLPLAGADAIIAGKVPPPTLGVEAVDPATLRITLAEPTPWLLALLTHHSFYPVPRKAIEAAGDQWTRPGNMLSNGAYMMSAWVPHGEITLVRNPHFHNAASVKFATVQHILTDDLNAGLRRYEAGELDMATVPGREFDRVKATYPDQLRVTPVLATGYLAINSGREELKDVRVRRALSMVLDRDTLMQRVLKGAQIPALGLIPPGGIPGYEPPQPDWATLPLPVRIEAAKKLLAEARGPDAPPLQLMLRTTKTDQTVLLCSAVVQMWKSSLGIDATLDTSEWSVLEQDIHHKNFQLAIYGWIGDYIDPWTYLSLFRADSGQINPSGYLNPKYEALLDRSRLEPDTERRFAMLEEAEAMLMADQPIIPLDFQVTQSLVSPHLAGFAPNPLNLHPSQYLSWKD